MKSDQDTDENLDSMVGELQEHTSLVENRKGGTGSGRPGGGWRGTEEECLFSEAET